MDHAPAQAVEAVGTEAAPAEAAPAPGRAVIQAKRALPMGGGGGELRGPPESAPPVADAPGPGRPLPRPVRSKMEAAFGTDFSSVQVHEDSQATALGAQAFARGEHLHFQPGRFDPDSEPGQELIGHELAHVTQQRAGRVARPMGKDGVNGDPSLEAEADRMGALAARGAPTGAPSQAALAPDGGPAQLRSILGAERVAQLIPAQGGHGGWRWVSGGGATHITIFVDDDTRDRIWESINANQMRRGGDNRIRPETIPEGFNFYYDGFHVTINGAHYYYDDAGNPLADGPFGGGVAIDDPSWATANQHAAAFAARDRYALNQAVNALGGHLPVSAEAEAAEALQRQQAEEQAAAEVQRQQQEAEARLNDPRARMALMQGHLAAMRMRQQAQRGRGRGRGRGGAPLGRVDEHKHPEKRRRDEPGPDEAPDEHESEKEKEQEKHRRTDGRDDDDHGSNGGGHGGIGGSGGPDLVTTQ